MSSTTRGDLHVEHHQRRLTCCPPPEETYMLSTTRGDLHVEVIAIALNFFEANAISRHLNIGHSRCCHVHHIEAVTRRPREGLKEYWHVVRLQCQEGTNEDVPN